MIKILTSLLRSVLKQIIQNSVMSQDHLEGSSYQELQKREDWDPFTQIADHRQRGN